jgi:hypothetical protein
MVASVSQPSVVHNGDMGASAAKVASQVRAMAKSRRLTATHRLAELIENGIEAEKQKQQEVFDLVEQFPQRARSRNRQAPG